MVKFLQVAYSSHNSEKEKMDTMKHQYGLTDNQLQQKKHSKFRSIEKKNSKTMLYPTICSKTPQKLTLLNPGSMLPESTTTTGDSLPVTHINPFQIISADVTIIPEIYGT